MLNHSTGVADDVVWHRVKSVFDAWSRPSHHYVQLPSVLHTMVLHDWYGLRFVTEVNVDSCVSNVVVISQVQWSNGVNVANLLCKYR